jgi:hypothetical protein
VVRPGQIKGTRGPGGEQDYALLVLLLSPDGVRTVFMADRLPTLEHVEKAFFYVCHQLGDQQGYVQADVIDPAVLLKSTGSTLLDRLFEPIECWLDGGAEPMPAMAADLLAVEAYSVTLELENGIALNWSRLSAGGFKPAYRRIGGTDATDQRRILKRLPRRGNAKGFS